MRHFNTIQQIMITTFFRI